MPLDRPFYPRAGNDSSKCTSKRAPSAGGADWPENTALDEQPYSTTCVMFKLYP